MSFHIGKLILKHLEGMGMNKSEFARRIGVTPQNVYSIFRRKSISTDLLFRISRVLDYDFFQYYTSSRSSYMLAAEDGKMIVSAHDLESTIDGLRKECELLRQENHYLKQLNDLMRDRMNGKPETADEEEPRLRHAPKRKKKK